MQCVQDCAEHNRFFNTQNTATMETSNFFRKVEDLQLTGNLQLTIAKGMEGSLIVSVLLNNEQCGDNAKKLIPPLTLKGTAAELDDGFFESIATPLKTASGLMVDMEAFMKQAEEAKRQSAMAKEKAEKEKKQLEAKKKKYEEAMAKADELEKEGKHKEAWMKVPDVMEYPEKTEEIRKRKTALAAKFTPDLFGAAQQAPETTAPLDKGKSAMENEDHETADEYESDDETIINH